MGEPTASILRSSAKSWLTGRDGRAVLARQSAESIGELKVARWNQAARRPSFTRLAERLLQSSAVSSRGEPRKVSSREDISLIVVANIPFGPDPRRPDPHLT